MKKAAFILTILGVLDSLYLMLVDILPCPLEVCSSGSFFSLPNFIPAFLGLLWFLTSAVVFFKPIRKLLSFWRFSGVAGATFLGTHALMNSYYCPFCFTAYVLGISLILLSEKLYG